MIHTEVYKFFKTCLPEQAADVREYFPNGKNSIRVRKANRQDFIFSFTEYTAWKYETVDHFLKDEKEKRS